jgi:hypothetical protein
MRAVRRLYRLTVAVRDDHDARPHRGTATAALRVRAAPAAVDP